MPAQRTQSLGDRDPDALRRFAVDLLDETDPLVLGHVTTGLRVTHKPDKTLVTQADLEVETLLRERIAAAFPNHGVVGEEFAEEAGDGETRWIIDPIDGTHNLVRGIPIFATLLAVERAGELLAAAVSAPALARRWHAARGEGAMVRDLLGERRLQVSAIDRLADAQVVWSGLRPLEASGFGPAVRAIAAGAWRDRGFGDFWGYMLVAEGAAEAMLEIGPTIWDLAAPALILAEAGGRLTDFAGRDSYAGPQALASNGRVHKALVEILSG
ncbi:MAG: histidinol phosphatase [Chloroflexota bacterium]|nr:histidinol phosphatase [Chloroflexota bacterium]